MRHPGIAILALSTLLAMAAEPGRAAGPKKKVLVELYTSQGCDACPPASELLGRLAELGYGPDRIVPINFHVDYFNEPWADPYADPASGRRQLEYNGVMKRDDLYFTPMLMIDGREPMLGSNRPKALATLDRSAAEAPAVTLDLAVTGPGSDGQKAVDVTLAARSPSAAGRDLVVGVALTEDPIATKVPSGENAGKTLVEHFVARSFLHKATRLGRSGSTTLHFPLPLAAGRVPARTRVAAFVQDRATGKIHQAESAPFEPDPAGRPASARAR